MRLDSDHRWAVNETDRIRKHYGERKMSRALLFLIVDLGDEAITRAVARQLAEYIADE